EQLFAARRGSSVFRIESGLVGLLALARCAAGAFGSLRLSSLVRFFGSTCREEQAFAVQVTRVAGIQIQHRHVARGLDQLGVQLVLDGAGPATVDVDDLGRLTRLAQRLAERAADLLD